MKELISWLNSNAEWVALDLETTGLDGFKDDIVDVQVGWGEEVSIFRSEFADELPALSTRPVLHHGKFDIGFLARKGIDVTHWQYHDTMLLGHLLDENRDSYSLDSYVKELWNDPYKEEFWAKYKSYQEAPEEARYAYGAADILYTGRLYEHLLGSFEADEIPTLLLQHVHRLQYALLKTEIAGIKVDTEYLVNLGVNLKSKIETLLPQMREMVSLEADLVELCLWIKELDKRKTVKGKARVPRPQFSFDSSAQLQTLLYNHLSLPIQYNDKTKNVSVDDSSLERIKGQHPVVPLIQEYRGLNKVYTAYIDGTLERMRDGRIYPEFRVNGTATGRISHANPNLGQLPKTGGVRGIYRPEEGNVFLSADYSQLEVCIEANLTGDTQLARIFTEGLSKHDITSTELRVSRDTAKKLNFALQYWCTARKVAKLLGVTEHEGEEIWKRYWEIYSGPKALKERTDRCVDSGEHLVTAFGRRRRFPVRRRTEFDGDYRQAYNFLIQGTGADLTSRAFYLISEWLQEQCLGRGLFTVHDEILLECSEKHWKTVEDRLIYTMVSVGDEVGLKIPLKAESSGPMSRWQD